MLVRPEQTKNLLIQWPQWAGQNIRLLLNGTLSMVKVDQINCEIGSPNIVDNLGMRVINQRHFTVARMTRRA
jgi:hypothetical protein